MEEEPQPDLDLWRQGDVALSVKELPVLATEIDGSSIELIPCEGVAVVSQSCDIVRNHDQKPHLQVAALCKATPEELAAVEAGSKPRYASLAGLRDKQLVVDFDVVATVEKKLVAAWERSPGCFSDSERRDFAGALSRHKARFAYPDAFNDSLKALRRWVEKKAGKASSAGRFIDSIEAILVRQPADWEKPEFLEFTCLLKPGISAADRTAWANEHIARMEGLATTEWCQSCTFRLATLAEMSAQEYLDSDRLDFDGLSDA